MGLNNVTQTGRSGMVAAKAAIATTGHNITNANTEGYTRQRVQQAAEVGRPGIGKHIFGEGVKLNRVERLNDEYLDKQIRNGGRELAHFEEKDQALRQVEDIFNELGGDGINRLMSRFFNEFRNLANDPDSEAVRQSVRESTQSLVNDFKRLRGEVNEVRRHIDSKLDGYTSEVNSAAEQLRDLNIRIKQMEVTGGSPNDLLDRRDTLLKQLGSYMDLNMHKDNDGAYIVDIRNVGPLVAGPEAEKFSVHRTPADGEGKPENALEIRSTAYGGGSLTHRIQGGRIGALLEVRDQTLSTVLERLDDMAYTLTNAVNQIHSQGFSRDGVQGIPFFKTLESKERASEFIGLSEEVSSNVNNIATAAIPDAPADNRIAIAISGLQGQSLMSGGKSTMDAFYNSIVSDVGVATARTRSSMNQAKDIQTQLNKIRDQVAGVSIDEETTNLLQFQHAFDASARVISVADEMLKTVLELKR